MPGSGDDYRAQVLAATNIVDLVGRSVALKRRGKDYVGLCPFHQEKSPSFTVSPSKQIFYCYGCKTGGSVFDFVMKRDRIEFVDALRLLGEQAGIEMPRQGAAKQKAGEKQVLYDMQSAACAFFEKSLADAGLGVAAREYLAKRQINSESIKRFQIGFAPESWDALLRNVAGRKISPEQLERGGLAKPRQQGAGHYDTFRNRLMFPIRDENGRVIAFGGRVMPGSQDPAKYLNSPETPLFSKGRCIFGIDLARQKMVETRTVVVVEGYTDVVVAHQCGMSNVVSVLGTAMTEQHVTLLRRFADRIILLFDADTAGDVAVDRTVGLFLTQPVEIAIASMPPGVDPDEYLLANGAEAFQNLLDGAADALSYKWKQLARQFNENGGDLTGQQRAIEAYLQVIGAARGSGPVDPIRWGQALARVSRLTDIPSDELNRRFRNRRPVRASVSSNSPGTSDAPDLVASEPPGPLTARDPAERRILGILLLHPRRWHEVQQFVHVEDFANPRHRRLAEMLWNHQRDEGEPVLSEFLGNLQDPNLVELAITAMDEVEALDEPDQILPGALHYLQNERRLKDEKKLVAALRRTNEERPQKDELDLLRELQEKVRTPDLRRV